jgi:sterol desaturase/sphingolipid hydroxylase (fatty acid hydroxylase superfamily)
MRLARGCPRSGRGWVNVLIAGAVTAAALALVASSLTEPVTVSAGLDRRTVALSVLLQIIGAGFVASAAAGALHARRCELATLVALGWPRRPVRKRLMREFGGVALAAGFGGSLRRAPARTLLGAVMIAAACAALGIEFIVRQVIDDVSIVSIGGWLGHPASALTSAIDITVVFVIVTVAIVTVADLDALTFRERASELRTLRAIGWSARRVWRLVVWEALLIGLTGGVAAGGVEMAVGLAVVHHMPPQRVAAMSLVVVGAGVVLSLISICIATIACSYVGGRAAGRRCSLFTNGFPSLLPWP